MIRLMEMADVVEVIDLGKMMHEESIYSDLDFNPQRLLALAEQVIPSLEYLTLVAEKDAKIVGLCVAYATPHFFGNDLTAGDLAIYMHPDHRGGLLGVQLVKHYIAWCDMKGVKHPMLGVSAGIKPERVGKLYRKLGFTTEYVIYKRP